MLPATARSSRPALTASTIEGPATELRPFDVDPAIGPAARQGTLDPHDNERPQLQAADPHLEALSPTVSRLGRLFGILALARPADQRAKLQEARTHDIAADTQQPRGPELVLAGVFVGGPHDHLLDVAPERGCALVVELPERAAKLGARIEDRNRGRRDLHRKRRRQHRVGSARTTRRHGDERQILPGDLPAAADQQRVVNGVLQLADVAHPGMSEQATLGRRRQRRDADASAGAQPARVDLQEIARQRQDVAGPISERVDGDLGDRQSIEQVLAEVPGRHRLFQPHVGGGDQPDVDGHRMPGAKPHHLVLLEDPQQLHLRGQGQIADLVEKQRPSVRLLEPSGLAQGGAGEGPLLVAEEIALDQRLREGAAVDGHEGSVRAVGELVDVAGHDLFPCPCLTGDEHRGAAGRHLLNAGQERARLRVLEDQRLGPHRQRQLLAPWQREDGHQRDSRW